MTNARLRKLWLGLVLCCAPAFSQTVTYQVSFPGVTSGPVLVPAFSFQYVSQGYLQPEGNGLTRLIGNPGFAMNEAPPVGFRRRSTDYSAHALQQGAAEAVLLLLL